MEALNESEYFDALAKRDDIKIRASYHQIKV